MSKEAHFEAGDWPFLAEGGQHIIFKYAPCGNNDNIISFKDKLLRIRKKYPNESGDSLEHEIFDSYESAVNDSLYPSEFRIEPILKDLNVTFLGELMDLNKSNRSSRYQDKQIHDARQDHIAGEIIPDALKLFKKPHDTTIPGDSNAHNTISLEIKVKGGYPSVSPFVSSSSIKRQFGRHHLKQLASMEEKEIAATSPTSFSISVRKLLSHDPLDLGSCNQKIIRSSLSDLVESPKKVLKCYVNGSPALGSFMQFGISSQGQTRQDATWAALCRETLALPLPDQAQDGGATSAGDLVLTASACVLAGNPLIKSLLRAQKLDFIDVEGAGAIHTRLVSLVGSHDAAAAALGQAVAGMSDLLRDLSCLLEAAPGGLSSTMESLPRPLRELAVLCEKGSGEQADLVAFTEGLSQQDCAVLLNLWLIALAAKDASIIMSFRCNSTKMDPSCTSQMTETEHLEQTEDTCGVVKLLCNGQQCGGCMVQLDYTLALIDIGYKSPAKCWNKLEEEGRFCDLATVVWAAFMQCKQ